MSTKTTKTKMPGVQEQIDRLQSELIMLRQQATASIQNVESHVKGNIAMNARLRCLELAVEKNGGMHAEPAKSADAIVQDAAWFESYVIGCPEPAPSSGSK